VAAAAHDILVSIYPDQKSLLNTALEKSLADVRESEGKIKGIALGKEAAEGVIAFRARRPGPPVTPVVGQSCRAFAARLPKKSAFWPESRPDFHPHSGSSCFSPL
jgi:hypothetical protein